MTTSLKWVIGIAIVVAALFALAVFVPIQGHAQVPSITLDWTAPADDDGIASTGPATTYQMRWSTVRPDTTSTAAMDTWWAGATMVPGLPTPLVLGTTQSVTVTGPFLTGTNYYFVMKACDEVPNCSGYSNVAVKFVPDTTPPSRIIDLRPR